MKKYLPLFSLAFTLACNSGAVKHTPLEDSLAKVNTTIKNELKNEDTVLMNKEAALTSFVQSFNEIQDNLNKIKEKEKIIGTSSSNIEFKKSNKDQIISDIQSIYDLLNKNKQQMAGLTKRLKDSKLEVADLETACNNLTTLVADKESEIADLKSSLEQLNVDFGSLKMKYEEEKQEGDLKTKALNTGHYVVGQTKELTRRGLITKEGGFIGIGKTTELSKNFDDHFFNTIDITQTTAIPLTGKRIKLVTIHPEGSYKLIGTEGAYTRLEILNVDKFWAASKYLIVTAD
jgi:hypothetical protein